MSGLKYDNQKINRRINFIRLFFIFLIDFLLFGYSGHKIMSAAQDIKTEKINSIYSNEPSTENNERKKNYYIYRTFRYEFNFCN
jgi:hypothetical protein